MSSYPALPAEHRIRTQHPSGQGTRLGRASWSAREVKEMNANRRRRAPLRITKRGQAVVTTLAALPLVVGALLVAVNGGVATATQISSSTTFEQVTVASGQSLWDLAASLAPSADPRDVVSDIVHLNQLHGADVQPGQQLAIPAQYSY
ncbi:MAG: LysM peptidoglycan-binding domain-containing protein [Terrimesophilobacter sp.]